MKLLINLSDLCISVWVLSYLLSIRTYLLIPRQWIDNFTKTDIDKWKPRWEVSS